MLRPAQLLLLLAVTPAACDDVWAYACVYSAEVADRDGTGGGASDTYFKVYQRSAVGSGSFVHECTTSEDTNDNTPDWGAGGDCCTFNVNPSGELKFHGYDNDVSTGDDSLGYALMDNTLWDGTQHTLDLNHGDDHHGRRCQCSDSP